MLESLPTASVIHIAAHASIFDGVHLADGAISALELHQLWCLRAKLVVLSACETGAGQVGALNIDTDTYIPGNLLRSEGVMGLYRALIAGGACAVMCSLWRVGDNSTTRLMCAFYKKLCADTSCSFALALQHAMLSMIDSDRKNDRENVWQWAAFSIVGDASGTLCNYSPK